MDKDLIALNELLDTAINEVLKETTDKFKIYKDPTKQFHPNTHATDEAQEFYTTDREVEVHPVKDQKGNTSQSNTETTQNSKPFQENNSVNQQPVNEQTVYHQYPPKEVYTDNFTRGVSSKNNTQTTQVNNRFIQEPNKQETVYNNSYTPSDFNQDNSIGDDYETETSINPAYRRMQKLRQPSRTTQQDQKTENQANSRTASSGIVRDSQKEREVRSNLVENQESNRQKRAQHPPMVTRSQWGALPPQVPMEPLQHPAKSIVFSLNTGTRPCTNQSDCQRLVREIQVRHMGQGLADIQYSFLVGGDGNMYEGRGWDLKSGIKEETNEDPCINIAFIGDYAGDPTAVPKSMLGPVQDMIIYGNSNRLIEGANMRHEDTGTNKD